MGGIRIWISFSTRRSRRDAEQQEQFLKARQEERARKAREEREGG